MKIAATIVIAVAACSLAPASQARSSETYTVVDRDSLGKIALKTGCSVEEIKEANGLTTDLIGIGQSLKIPKCSGPERSHEGETVSVTHEVRPRDTLGGIAKRYGTTVSKIKSDNGLKSDIVVLGQKLKVVPRIPVREQRKFTYVVQPEDNCGEIAGKFGMKLRDFMELNPKKTRDGCTKLRARDVVYLYGEGPKERSKTVGSPQSGRLVNAEQLPPGPGYYRRRPGHAYGTNQTISAMLEAVAAVRMAHRTIHDIAIGDISSKSGGRLRGHKSHQSGRDVDLGFYFKGQPPSGPKAFLSASSHELDYEANWSLINALVGRDASDSRVEYIFVDYRVQKRIYDWAKKKKKASQAVLDRIFQYPNGKYTLQGIIRHEPGHSDHFHVRFRCPRGNASCS
ncbi:MAG: penicillin-insensitive murein endopeptidase [Myxococcota bacterium]